MFHIIKQIHACTEKVLSFLFFSVLTICEQCVVDVPILSEPKQSAFSSNDLGAFGTMLLAADQFILYKGIITRVKRENQWRNVPILNMYGR
jgi:hypothetical protein